MLDSVNSSACGQLPARVYDCDSGCRGFESHQPPHRSYNAALALARGMRPVGAAEYRFRLTERYGDFYQTLR